MFDDSIEKIRVKAKKFLNSQVIREDIERGFSRKGEHLFYRLSMPFDDVLDIYDNVVQKLDESELANEVEIKNLEHPKDTNEFLFMYNAIFLAAPDPSRPLNEEEARLFPEDNTYIATLWQSFTGFIYVVVEQDPFGTGEKVGAIAGIGVLPKYRGRRIGLRLIKTAIDHLRDKNVNKLMAEVYEENEASLKMFKSLGMEIVGSMILEEEEKLGSKEDETADP